MRVILPSNGLLGTKSVDLREPKFYDLRKTMNTADDEYLFKYDFVKNLCEFDPKTITMDDIEHLFGLAATSVLFNTIKFSTKCDCGTIASGEFSFAEDEIKVRTLHKDSRKCKKTIDGTEYVFHILSAQDGVDIHTYGLDDDEGEKKIEEATVCKVLGYDITDENIEKIRELPISIYVACFLFIKANKHGMEIFKLIECPKCKKKLNVKIEINSSLVKIDLPHFIEKYASVYEVLDFKSFLEFTVPELKNFVDYINAQAKKNE